MTTLANNKNHRAMSWAIIFLLLATTTAWAVGDRLFFAALVGAVLGWWK